MASTNKQLTILTSAEIEELYGVPQFTPAQQEYYFDLNDAEQALLSGRSDPLTKAYLILFLGHFKYKPMIQKPAVKETLSDLRFIRQKFNLQFKLPKAEISSGQKAKLYAAVLRQTGYVQFNVAAQGLGTFVGHLAEHTVDPRELFDRCSQFLSERKIAFPAYWTLQTIISAGIRERERQLHARLLEILSDETYEQLRQLVGPEMDEQPLLSQLKKPPKGFSASEIKNEIQAFRRIKPLFPFVSRAIEHLNLTKANIHQYYTYVNTFSIGRVREFSKPVFALNIICYLYHRYYQMSDTLINAFIFNVRKLSDDAKRHAKEQRDEDLSGMAKKIKQSAELLMLYVNKSIDGKTRFDEVRDRAFSILPEREIPVISDFLCDVEADLKKYEWDYYASHKVRIKDCLRPLFLGLDFSSTESSSLLIHQIARTRSEFLSVGKLRTFDTRLVKPKKIEPHFFDTDTRGNRKLNRTKAEMLLYLKLKDQLESRKVYVKDSLTFHRLEDRLMSSIRAQQLLNDGPLSHLMFDVRALVREKVQLLERMLREVSRKLTAGENPAVTIKDVKGKTKFSIERKPASSVEQDGFYEKVGQIHIGDILAFAERHTSFTTAFKHIRLKDGQPPDLDALIGCIVANGARFGVHHMAKLCEVPYDALHRTEKNYLRLETLHAASDFVSDAIAQLPIFRHYNIQDNLIHASFDGQKFESRMNTIRTRYSSKYLGRGKGLSALSLCANHVPINAKMMGLNEHESHHLFDLMYNNTSQIQPDVVSTDTHGTNQINFALLDLSGWQFAPRYKNPGKVLAELFVCERNGSDIRISLKKSIRESSIIDGWHTVERIMATLHSKEASQSTIVRMLSGAKGRQSDFRALLEYDRLIKSIYMLDYLNDEDLRGYVHRALNRGESYHQLQRRIEQVNDSKFRGMSDDEIDLWYECGRLLCTCIIYFNSYLLSLLLQGFERTKQPDKIAMVLRCSPVAWTHVNLNGRYFFASGASALNIESLVLRMMA